MEKIVNNTHFIRNKLYEINTKMEIISNYLPIIIKKRKQRTEKKLEKERLIIQEKILPLEKDAMIDSDYLKRDKQSQLQKVEDKYQRKLCRFNQAKKHHLEKRGIDMSKQEVDEIYDIKFDNIKHERKVNLQRIEELYQRSTTNIEEKRAEYEKVLLQLDTEYQNLENQLVHKDNAYINKITHRYNLLLERLRTRKQWYLKKIDNHNNKEMNKAILKVNNLSMNTEGIDVDELNFEIKKASVFGLLKPRGNGVTVIKKGEIYYQNRFDEVVFLNKYPIIDLIKEGIVRTIVDNHLVNELDIIDNLLIGAHSLYQTNIFDHVFHTKRLRIEELVLRKKAEDILYKLNLAYYKHKYPHELTYLILKKLELARALMSNPRLIILDHPTTHLNEKEMESLKELILDIVKEYQISFLVITHEHDFVSDLCDEIKVIKYKDVTNKIKGNKIYDK